jgi:outer membrane protein OmpA-like peptidoglycan-associated protein
MKRIFAIALACMFVAGLRPAGAEEGVIAGVDLGFARPLRAFNDASDTGGVFSPFVGYMANDYLGAMGQLQVFGMPNENRPGVLDDDATWAVGGAAGPRAALPLGRGELYGTWQGGIFTGLAPNSSVTDTSWGFSTGGGLNVRITDQLLLGGFARYNRLYQRVHGEEDAKYITGGFSLTYNRAAPPPPPPPPAPVAQVQPPPPPPPAKQKIVLRGVNFDFDKSDIRADARPVLDEAVETLKQEGGIAVVAEGHTDAVGSDSYNDSLSQRRAGAVRDYLVDGGISSTRIQVEGFGESRPVASNDTDDGRAQNRRVELLVVGD